jgi:hypothetical protein
LSSSTNSSDPRRKISSDSWKRKCKRLTMAGDLLRLTAYLCVARRQAGMHEQGEQSAKPEKLIWANLEGIGYGG